MNTKSSLYLMFDLKSHIDLRLCFFLVFNLCERLILKFLIHCCTVIVDLLCTCINVLRILLNTCCSL